MFFRRLAASWLLPLPLLLLLAGSVAAAAAPALSKKTYQILQETQDQLAGDQSAEAIAALQALVKETSERPYEQAIALQVLGNAYLVREDYASAIPHLKHCIELEVLPDDVQQNIRLNLAQLYLATDRFSPAIELLTLWLKNTSTPTAEAYVMLGSAYLQLKRYKQAIAPLRKAIELSENPRESWYQSLLAAYNELRDYPNCAALLHVMLKRFPDRPQYWRQLSGIEVLRERYPQALAAMELAYLNGYLETERDLLNLAQLYSYLDAPYKAARLIEREMAEGRITTNRKSLELASNAWYQAKEYARSIVALERLVKIDKDPQLGIQLAQLYLAKQRWGDAEKGLEVLLEGKQTKTAQRAKIWLLLGIARFEQKEFTTAKSAFLAATEYPESRDDAEQWLAFLQQEY